MYVLHVSYAKFTLLFYFNPTFACLSEYVLYSFLRRLVREIRSEEMDDINYCQYYDNVSRNGGHGSRICTYEYVICRNRVAFILKREGNMACLLAGETRNEHKILVGMA
jgi:hypothetical protein